MPDKTFYLVEEPLYAVVKELSGPYVAIHPMDGSVLRLSPPGELAKYWRKPSWSENRKEVLEEALKQATLAADKARLSLSNARSDIRSIQQQIKKLK